MAKKITTFEDYNREIEKNDLKKVRRGITKNDIERQQHIGNKTNVFNKVTHKIDDLSPAEINDKIEGLEKKNENHNTEGLVIIEIGGDGEIKEIVEQQIKDLLKNIGGEIHLLIDGEEVNLNN